jgi:orotate phosphoribosyltransferase
MESLPDLETRLLKLLQEKSLQRGRFQLRSGKWSDYYVDGKQTTLDAEGAYLVGRVLFERIRSSCPVLPSGIGGVTLGADPIVTAISVVSYLEGLPIPAFIIRKEPKGHGTGRWIEGLKNIPESGRVVLVEDVLTTGGTLMEGVRRVREAGLSVERVYVVLDRQEGGRANLEAESLPLEVLFTRQQLLAT